MRRPWQTVCRSETGIYIYIYIYIYISDITTQEIATSGQLFKKSLLSNRLTHLRVSKFLKILLRDCMWVAAVSANNSARRAKYYSFLPMPHHDSMILDP